MIMKKVIISIILAVLLSGCAMITSRLLERSGDTVTVGTYQLEMTLDRTPEQVFEHLSHFDEMEGGLEFVDFVVPPESRISTEGQYMDGVGRLLGLKFDFRFVVVEFEQDRAMTYAMAGTGRGWMQWAIEPVGDQTLFKGNFHVFAVPDSPSGALITSIFNNENIMEGLVRQTMTDNFKGLKARIEGKPVDSVRLDKESYKIFVDPYFTVERDFDISPKKMFEILRTKEGLNTVFSGNMSFEPRDDSFTGTLQVGDAFVAVADLGQGVSLEYDAFVVQTENDQVRLVLHSPDVIMEWDCLVMPTLTGSRVVVIMIVNYSDNLAGQSFDVVMHTSQMDKWAEQGLAALGKKYETGK